MYSVHVGAHTLWTAGPSPLLDGMDALWWNLANIIQIVC